MYYRWRTVNNIIKVGKGTENNLWLVYIKTTTYPCVSFVLQFHKTLGNIYVHQNMEDIGKHPLGLP